MSLTIKIHITILALFIALIGFQVLDFQRVQPKNPERIHALFENIIRMDAASEENMLAMMNHRVSHYDDLTANTLALNQAYTELTKALAGLQTLQAPLASLQASISTQTKAINGFKSELGIFMNSARYLPLLIDQYIAEHPSQQHLLLTLKGKLFEYLLFPDNDVLKQAILVPQLSNMSNIEKHINILLTYKPKIQQRIDTVLHCGIPESTYLLSDAHDRLYQVKMDMMQHSRSELIVMVILLLAYLIFLLFTLLTYSRKLKAKQQAMALELVARKEAEERYRALIESSSAAIMTYADNRFISANSATLRMFGVQSVDDILQMSALDISPSLQADGRRSDVAAEDYVETALRDGCCAFEWLHQKINGDVFPAHVQLTCIALNHKKVLQAVVTDLSEMESLRQEKDRLIAALEHTAECVLITNHEAKILYVNEAFERLTGYVAAEVIGEYASLLRSETVKASVYKSMIDTLNDGKIWQGELLIRCKDGRELATERSISPIFDHVGNVIEHVAMFHDVSELKKQAKQLEHTQRLESLGVLAGGIAHDFNNILMAIMGNAALAERSLDDTSPAKEKLMVIEQASQRAADLCQQMLAYSGKGKFIVKTVGLSEMVNGMMHLMEVSIEKNVVLKYHLAENLPHIDVDVAQIQQIILNLITNANEAIGSRSGVISLSTGVMHADRAYLDASYCDSHTVEGQYAYIEVSDTGCGMDKIIQSKMFDPFFTTKFTGRGLGMSAALGIVRGHQGALRVYSEVGKGTTFKVLFPISKQCEAALEVPEKTSDAWQSMGTILIVDDEETIREVASVMLESMGFATLSAENGVQAVELYRQHQHDISAVLLDMTMPKMDGRECFRELRRMDEHVQVILSSGYSEEDATSRFNGKGLAGFIQKPYNPETLEALMKSLKLD